MARFKTATSSAAQLATFLDLGEPILENLGGQIQIACITELEEECGMAKYLPQHLY